MILLPAQSESTYVLICGLFFLPRKLLDSPRGFDEVPRDPLDLGPVAHFGLSHVLARCLRRELQVGPIQTQLIHKSNQSPEP